MSDKKEKVIVRLKDRTSVCWLPAQEVKIVGDKPVIVTRTHEISTRIKLGVLVEMSNQEYESFHKKFAKTTEQKITLAIEVFENMVIDKDVKSAEKQLVKIGNLGVKGRKMTGFQGRVTHLKNQIEQEAIKTARKEIAVELVESCIEADVFVTDDKKFLCLGELRLGTDAEMIIDWAAQNDDNIEQLKTALVEKQKGSESNTGDDNPE